MKNNEVLNDWHNDVKSVISNYTNNIRFKNDSIDRLKIKNENLHYIEKINKKLILDKPIFTNKNEKLVKEDKNLEEILNPVKVTNNHFFFIKDYYRIIIGSINNSEMLEILEFKTKIKKCLVKSWSSIESLLYTITDENILNWYFIKENKIHLILDFKNIINIEDFIIKNQSIFIISKNIIKVIYHELKTENAKYEEKLVYKNDKDIKLIKFSNIQNLILIIDNSDILKILNLDGLILREFNFEEIKDMYQLQFYKNYEDPNINNIYNFNLAMKDYLIFIKKDTSIIIYDLSVFDESKNNFKIITSFILNDYLPFRIDFDENSNNNIIKFDLNKNYLVIISRYYNLIINFEINKEFNENNTDFILNYELIKLYDNSYFIDLVNVINENKILNDSFYIINYTKNNYLNLFKYQITTENKFKFIKNNEFITTEENNLKNNEIKTRSKSEIKDLLKKKCKNTDIKALTKNNDQIDEIINKKLSFEKEELSDTKKKIETKILNLKIIIEKDLQKIEKKIFKKLDSYKNVSDYQAHNNKINEILNNLKNNISVSFSTNLSSYLDKLGIPVIEKYLKSFNDKIETIFENSNKFYNEKINIESMRNDIIKENFANVLKEVSKSIDILSKTLKEITIDCNLDSKDTDDKGKKTKENNILLNKLNEIIESQNYISIELKSLKGRIIILEEDLKHKKIEKDGITKENVENDNQNDILKENTVLKGI